MDEQLKRLTRVLQIEYGFFILIPILISISYESGWLPEGIYAIDARMQYILGTVAILLAVIFLPLSLKIFGKIVATRIKDLSLNDAMKIYKRWSEIRLMLLAIVVIPNVVIYYVTLNNIGGLCALMGVTASFFCLPYQSKVKQELDITN